MATHQNTSVDSDRIALGNYKIETASSSGATYVNLGAGQLTSWAHVFEKYTLQAGNAPDPMEGIATETCAFAFDLLEYDASAFSALQCGLISTGTITSVLSVINAGGNTVLTPRAFRLTNTREISGASSPTVIVVYRGVIDNGMVLVPKSDNDTDPMNVYQFSVTGENDSTLSVGSQLFSITKIEI